MYKLFLCFRYLTRKGIVIFPILAVCLCVMMLVIVDSIMGGFVDRVIDSSRGLMGDVVVESQSLAGFPYYDDVKKDIEKLPEVQAVTPVVQAFGLLNVPGHGQAGVQIIGIDPVSKSKVSDFRQSLFRQYIAPTEAVTALSTVSADDPAARNLTVAIGVSILLSIALWVWGLLAGSGRLKGLAGFAFLAFVLLVAFSMFRRAVPQSTLPATSEELQARSQSAYEAAEKNQQELAYDIDLHGSNWPEQKQERYQDRLHLARLATDSAWRVALAAKSLPPGVRYTTAAQLTEALVPAEPTFKVPPEALNRYGSSEDVPDQGCVIGVDVGLTNRDKRGNYVRDADNDFLKAILTIVPISRGGDILKTTAQQEDVIIVDDSNTKVFDIDKSSVYAPFDLVQKMALMHAQKTESGGEKPARCNELQVRIKNSRDDEALRQAREHIQKIIDAYVVNPRYKDMPPGLDAQTWKQKQGKFIGAVENEKRMITVILGIMSMVVVVVVFLIFYMIVRDKTRDIGIIKAIGGSEEGVAGIFMTYGLLIGAVGGILGVIGGVAFVTHTNQIHEWIFEVTGIMIWDRSVYLFDRIPDQVHPLAVVIIFASALLAGLVGAIIPAAIAGAQNPVRALRYE